MAWKHQVLMDGSSVRMDSGSDIRKGHKTTVNGCEGDLRALNKKHDKHETKRNEAASQSAS